MDVSEAVFAKLPYGTANRKVPEKGLRCVLYVQLARPAQLIGLWL
jgi:hypothetical protein